MLSGTSSRTSPTCTSRVATSPRKPACVATATEPLPPFWANQVISRASFSTWALAVASLLHRTLPWRVPGLEPLRLRPTLTPGRMRATAVVAHSSISMREEVLASSDLCARAPCWRTLLISAFGVFAKF